MFGSFKKSLTCAAFSLLFAGMSQPVVNAQTQPAKTKPATNEELNVYLQMSTLTFCAARTNGLDFRKSMQVALTGVGNAIFTKHGGVVTGNPKPLSQQEFASFTALNIAGGALRAVQNRCQQSKKRNSTNTWMALKKLANNIFAKIC